MGSCLSTDGRQSSSSSHSRGRKHNGLKKKKKKGSWQSSSYRREEQLHKIPGRLFLNGSSGVTSLFTQQGRKGTNQDAMIAWENFGSREDTVLCGVFDGHGPYGHLVARRVRDSLPLNLSAHFSSSYDNLRQNSLSTVGSMNSEDTSSMCLDEEPGGSLDSVEREKYPEIFMTLKESFLKAFKVMDKELKVHPKIDSFCSGTTAVTLIKQGQDLIIGNVGDSRAVLGTRDENDTLTAVQLTVDLKPNLPKEEERIRHCKGRVFALQDEPEVARVWLPNNNSPGLAMARAFGDFCLKDFGLISVPEISYRHLTEKDDFIVLATDGVWDVLSNMEVVEVISSAPSRSSAARFLVESAVRAWRYKYPTSKVDDCAVVCLFLNADSSNSTPSYSDGRVSESSVTLENDYSNEESSVPLSLERSATVRTTSDHIFMGEANGSPRNVSKSHSGKRTSNGIVAAADETDWSAMECVARVDTLLTLPRFVDIDGKQQADMNSQKF